MPTYIKDINPSVVTKLSVLKWLTNLKTPNHPGRDLSVNKVEHVKAFSSIVDHEFLIFTISLPGYGRTARIIAERQTSRDQVIVGPWEGQGRSSSSDSVYTGAAVMYTLVFRNLKVLALAQTLRDVSTAQPEYKMLSYNCFWFSLATYRRLKNSNGVTETRGPSADALGKPWSIHRTPPSITPTFHAGEVWVQAEGFGEVIDKGIERDDINAPTTDITREAEQSVVIETETTVTKENLAQAALDESGNSEVSTIGSLSIVASNIALVCGHCAGELNRGRV